MNPAISDEILAKKSGFPRSEIFLPPWGGRVSPFEVFLVGCRRIYAPIIMKFEIKACKIVIDHRIKFHEDPSFRCGDIYKTTLAFV